jgi:predicted Zn-dependent peptidase
MSIEEIEREVDLVNYEAVLSLARELFVPERLGLCVLGPVDEAEVRWQRDAA